MDGLCQGNVNPAIMNVAHHGDATTEEMGTLSPTDWANELHPYSEGFQAIAAKFVDALRFHFPGRI